MNGQLAQAIAIVTRVNASVAGVAPEPDFSPNSALIPFCSEPVFQRKGGEALGAAAYARSVKRRGVPLRLWGEGIAELDGEKQWIWSAAWQVKKGKGGTSWDVTYAGVATGDARCFPAWDLRAAAQELDASLVGIREFALKEAQEWAEWFDSAREALISQAPKARWYDEAFCATAYPLEAKRLYAAASGGSVFGGMGSWNDAWFEDAEREARVSSRLHAALEGAFHASVNCWP